MASQAIESHRAGAEVVTGDATCRKKSVELLEELGLPKGLLPMEDVHPGVWVQPRVRVHVAGAGEEEGRAHIQEDQADGVLCRRGHGIRREGQAEQDHRRQDQGTDALAQCRRGICSRGIARESHLQDRHWPV